MEKYMPFSIRLDTNADTFGLVGQLFLFDSTRKLIDGPVVTFLHFVINSLMHGFYTVHLSCSKMLHEYFYLQVYLPHDP